MSSGTTHVSMSYALTWPASTSVDITIRIGATQLEKSAYATSNMLQAVGDLTVISRAGDICRVASIDSNNWFRPEVGTIVAEYQVYAYGYQVEDYRRIFQLTNGDTASNLVLAYYDAGGNIYTSVVGSSANKATFNGLSSFVTSVQKIAMAWDSANQSYRLSLNGSTYAPSSTNSGSIGTMTELRIGYENSAYAEDRWLHGYIRKVTYYNDRYSNTDLGLLTT
jgi:hypothetical protein